MSIASQCGECCILALRGRNSTAMATGEDSYTISLDKFLHKYEVNHYFFYNVFGNTDPDDPYEDEEEDVVFGEDEIDWRVVEPTVENPHPDPRNLNAVVLKYANSADSWSCGIVISPTAYGTIYSPNPYISRPRTISETSGTVAGSSYSYTQGFNYGSGYIEDRGSSFSVTSVDSNSNVRARLSAAQAGGWAFGYYGFDPTNYHSFDDLAYPGLGYYSAAGGTYYGLWQIFNPLGGCVYGGGETNDLSLSSNTTNFGLSMAKHPYFNSKYMTYELNVAHNLRRFNQLKDFHGCFSTKGSFTRTLTFEKVIRACWLELHTLSICTATSNVTTDTKNDHIYAENEIYDPVDQYGSTEYDHASWSNPNLNARFEEVAWSTDNEDLGVKHSDFCFRNKLLFVSSRKVKITVQKTVINYKDIFDDPTNPNWAEVLATQFSAPTVTISTMELTNEARVSGFFTSETSDDFKVRPSNYRQIVWLKITRVFTTTAGIDNELPLSSILLYCARRYGNMGFPQLNDQASGALYKGARGFKKASRWFAKMRHVHDETLVSGGSCPTPSCTTYDKTGVDLATEVEFECLLDPLLTYELWTDTRKVFERDWRCTGAISSLGESEWGVPFDGRSGRPQIWGSLGFTTITALSASKSTTSSSTGLLYALASPSAVPYRYLNADMQQEQDKIGDAFTTAEGCSTNSVCTNDCTGPRSNDYSEYRHAATTTPIADPFFGLNNIISVETVTVAVDKTTTGYFGKKDTDETRLNEAAISTDVLYFSAPNVGTYVTLRNFWLK